MRVNPLRCKIRPPRLFGVLTGLFGSALLLGAGAAQAQEVLFVNNFRSSPGVVQAGQTITFTFTVTNRSNRTILSQGPPPGTVYRQGQSWRDIAANPVEGRARVGVSISGPRGRQYPYRWGLGEPLPPGESRTVQGKILFTQPGFYNFYGAVFVEGEETNPVFKTINGVRVLDRERVLPRTYRPPVPPTRIMVGDDIINSPVPPMIVQGNVFVPIRFPSEHMGADVDWNNIEKIALIEKDGRVVKLRIGDYNAWVNDNLVTLTERPYIFQARTYVPLRFVAESLGARVTWDGPTRTVRIYP